MTNDTGKQQKLPPGMVMGPDGKPCRACNSLKDFKLSQRATSASSMCPVSVLYGLNIEMTIYNRRYEGFWSSCCLGYSGPSMSARLGRAGPLNMDISAYNCGILSSESEPTAPSVHALVAAVSPGVISMQPLCTTPRWGNTKEPTRCLWESPAVQVVMRRP
jgi:hypothetical protein